MLLTAVKEFGIEVFPQPTGEILIDMDDLVFYEVAMGKKMMMRILLPEIKNIIQLGTLLLHPTK